MNILQEFLLKNKNPHDQMKLYFINLIEFGEERTAPTDKNRKLTMKTKLSKLKMKLNPNDVVEGLYLPMFEKFVPNFSSKSLVNVYNMCKRTIKYDSIGTLFQGFLCMYNHYNKGLKNV